MKPGKGFEIRRHIVGPDLDSIRRNTLKAPVKKEVIEKVAPAVSLKQGSEERERELKKQRLTLVIGFINPKDIRNLEDLKTVSKNLVSAITEAGGIEGTMRDHTVAEVLPQIKNYLDNGTRMNFSPKNAKLKQKLAELKEVYDRVRPK